MGDSLINGVSLTNTMTSMDLSKMDPMARKMETAVRAFNKALEDGDANAANEHLQIIKNTSDFLSDDLWSIVQKGVEQPTGPNQRFAGGVPIKQFAETGQVLDVGNRGDMVKGLILPARTGGIMQPQRSPGQRL